MIGVLNQSKMFCKTPAEIMFIDDEYTAYCFNEAAMFIRYKIESGESPIFEVHHKSFSELYSKYDN